MTHRLTRRAFAQALAPGLLAAGSERLSIVEAGTDRPIAARVLALDASGQDFVPPGATVVRIAPDRWFAAEGPVALPDGAYTIYVERGPEYRPVKTTKRRVALERWIDMRERGYSSGDCHLHVAADTLLPMLNAEALDFGASLYWWNGPKLKIPPHPDTTRLSIYDAEVEHTWGAVYLAGLREPLSIPPDPGRANLAYVREARRQDALICYQGGWSREVLVDALLGYVDVVNVCNNNFHRFKFQPRPQYSNLLEVPGFPEYPATAEGMIRMNTDTYYRLLNCGLRLAAGAESATGAKTTPAGYNRAYVHTGKNASLQEFYAGWRRGRNFVTNGPMIFLTAGGHREPGDTIALPRRGGSIEVTATAISDQPLGSLEVVANGEVVARGPSPVHSKLRIREGTWIAARATAEDLFLSAGELDRHRSENTRGGERPTRLRFGHTSPIYVTVGGTGVRVSAAVQQARQMLDAFERFAQRTAREPYLAEALDSLAAARDQLRNK